MHSSGPWTWNTCFGGWNIRPAVTTPAGESVALIRHESAGGDAAEKEANAKLIAAAPELLSCLTGGASKNMPDFLDWIADRLVGVYGESERNDYIISLRNRSSQARAAMSKAIG